MTTIVLYIQYHIILTQLIIPSNISHPNINIQYYYIFSLYYSTCKGIYTHTLKYYLYPYFSKFISMIFLSLRWWHGVSLMLQDRLAMVHHGSNNSKTFDKNGWTFRKNGWTFNNFYQFPSISGDFRGLRTPSAPGSLERSNALVFTAVRRAVAHHLRERLKGGGKEMHITWTAFFFSHELSWCSENTNKVEKCSKYSNDMYFLVFPFVLWMITSVCHGASTWVHPWIFRWDGAQIGVQLVLLSLLFQTSSGTCSQQTTHNTI